MTKAEFIKKVKSLNLRLEHYIIFDSRILLIHVVDILLWKKVFNRPKDQTVIRILETYLSL